MNAYSFVHGGRAWMLLLGLFVASLACQIGSAVYRRASSPAPSPELSAAFPSGPTKLVPTGTPALLPIASGGARNRHPSASSVLPVAAAAAAPKPGKVASNGSLRARETSGPALIAPSEGRGPWSEAPEGDTAAPPAAPPLEAAQASTKKSAPEPVKAVADSPRTLPNSQPAEKADPSEKPAGQQPDVAPVAETDPPASSDLIDPAEPPRDSAVSEVLQRTPLRLPLAARPDRIRPTALEAIAQECDRHSRRGLELAGRKAYFAARAEMVLALRLLAEGLDAQQESNVHALALDRGLTALRECDDFVPRAHRRESVRSLPEILRQHRTPVLKEEETNGLSSLEALKCYLTFAQEQLSRAADGEVAGSMALYALAKLHAAQVAQPGGAAAGEAKAVCCYQAAVLTCPDNSLAWNDLGVLLARYGNNAAARGALEQSVAVRPQAETWHNLAVVYTRLGDRERARRAGLLAQQAARGPGDPNSNRLPPVAWVDPGSFARSFADLPDARATLPARSGPAPFAGAPSGTAAGPGAPGGRSASGVPALR